MNRLCLAAMLIVFEVFFLFSVQNAQAACVIDSSVGQVNGSDPNYVVKFGAQINTFAGTSGNDCDHHITDIDSTPGALLTGKSDDSYNAASASDRTFGTPPFDFTVNLQARSNANASIANGTVSSTVYEYGETLGASSRSNGHFIDLVLVENLTADLDEINYIPVTFCSELSSPYEIVGSNGSRVGYGDYNFGTDNSAADGLIWDSGSSGTVVHSSNGKVCHTGSIKMHGRYVWFVVKLSTLSIGNLGAETLDTPSGPINIPVRHANMNTSFEMGELPPGAKCESASGVWPGCDGLGPKPDFKLSDIRVTQAVFDSTKLVKDRKTAVLANVELLEGEWSDEVLVGGQLNDELGNKLEDIPTQSVTFAQNRNPQPIELFFTPKTQNVVGANRKVVLTVDPPMPGRPNGQIDESDENNNAFPASDVFEVVKTHDLKIGFAYREPPNCPSNGCSGDAATYNDHIAKSKQFLSEVFPLSDTGLKISSRLFSEKDTGRKAIVNPVPTSTSCGQRLISNSLGEDFKYVSKVLKLGKDVDRVVMVVPKEYLEMHLPTSPTVRGFQSSHAGGIAVSLVTSDGQITAHELGHTFQMPIPSLVLSPGEGYPIDLAKCESIKPYGTIVSGYNLRSAVKKEVKGALDFMGAGEKNNGNYWIALGHWDHLLNKFSTKLKDPELISFDIDIHKDGTITAGTWHVFDGTPSFVEPGPYSIIFKDEKGEIIETVPFRPDFTIHLEPGGTVEMDKAPVLYYLPYPLNTAFIEVIDPHGAVLAKVDPVIKVLNDGIKGIPDFCFISSSNTDRETLLNGVLEIQLLLQNSNIIAAKTKLQEIRIFAESSLVNTCDIQDPLATNREKMLTLIDNSIDRILARLVEKPDVPGDLDGDGDIDNVDFQAFQAAFGRCEGQEGYNAKANFDSDTCITFVDYQSWYGLFTAQQQ